MHYGMPRRSGRYPWGSGENPYQHESWFLSRIKELQNAGMTEKEIASALGMSTTQLRVQKSIEKNQLRADLVATARGLQEKGYNTTEIARMMGYNNESSVRSLLNASSEVKAHEAQSTADFLKKQVDSKGMIDVGVGVERELNVSRTKMDQAIAILQNEGYELYGGRMPQATNPGQYTILKVLCPPGTEHKEIFNYDQIHNVGEEYTSHDDGETFDKFVYPKSMDSSRLAIRYAEDGGLQKDGLVEIRRGVEDLSLGNDHYAQVRILVDDSKYIKGMAVYSDDLPDGVDVLFNTNKTKDKSKLEVLKDIKDDPENPFGSAIKANGQSYYDDANGNKQLSLINKRAGEGDWEDWAKKVPSQFLAKQNTKLAENQLKLTASDRDAEFAEIKSLTNPTVKKALLESFATDCDAAAVHLKAAALPRQRYQVLIPLTNIKDNEVYAPNFKDGEKVALIRFPHGGTFEIPILTVNNKNTEGKKVLSSTPADAIGISSKVAERLSGADFDGDTALVIPTNSKVKITSTNALKGLEGFDPKTEYPYREGMKTMKNTQKEMGVISNLITDMTVKGANEEELARAVRHSMVVIDAEKHKLDYTRSYEENGIAALKKKYQAHTDDEGSGGASTLLSKAKSTQYVLKSKGQPKIDPDTGELIYNRVVETYTDKQGKTQVRTVKSTKMAETSDARTLSTGTKIEEIYADYANHMKSLANQARKEIIATGNITYSPTAAKEYSSEVSSLNAKLNIAAKNAPRERQAQAIANTKIKALKKSCPDMTKDEAKKKADQALASARTAVGAKRHPIEISDNEWKAIQSGAISETKLKEIIRYTNIDSLREKSLPKSSKISITSAQAANMRAMSNAGYTNAQIAERYGISPSTVSKYINQ
jgi:DNA-binding NarL/FixJ family response regulator